MASQGRVEYLVEVADACQSADCAYTVNGETVSDFYTPPFFDLIAIPGARYSFSGKIQRPRQVLKGGCLSWFEGSGRQWWQAQWYTGKKPAFVDFGELVPDMSFRAEIDGKAPRHSRPRASGAIKRKLAEDNAFAAKAPPSARGVSLNT